MSTNNKAKKAPIHKKEEWVEVLDKMELKSRVKILVDMFSTDIGKVAKVTKLSVEVIEGMLKEA